MGWGAVVKSARSRRFSIFEALARMENSRPLAA